MAKFFVDAMGLSMVQERKDDAVDLTDGSVNISILPLAANRSRRAGLDHIGFCAEDDQEQIRRVEAAVSDPASVQYPPWHGAPASRVTAKITRLVPICA